MGLRLSFYLESKKSLKLILYHSTQPTISSFLQKKIFFIALLSTVFTFIQCSELCAIIGIQGTKVSHFGNSVPKMYTTQEDYKPVIICVHFCQIPIFTVSGKATRRPAISIATLTSIIYKLFSSFFRLERTKSKKMQKKR